MSNAAQAWAWKQDVPTATKCVLVALADHADDEGVCWPGLKGIGQKCQLTRRSVQRHTAYLIKKGLLFAEERKRPDMSQTSNLYYLNMGGAPDEHNTLVRQNRHAPMTDMTPTLDSDDIGGATPVTRGGDTSDTPRTLIEPSVESPITSISGEIAWMKPFGAFETFKRIDASELAKLTREKFPRLDWGLEAHKFSDHWSRPGKKLTRFKLAWLNWCQNAVKFAQENDDGRRPAAGARFANTHEKYVEESRSDTSRRAPA